MNAQNNNYTFGIEIDINRMLEAKKKLELHVNQNPKDHSPKIKLKRNAAKIKKLLKILEGKKDPQKRSVSKFTRTFPKKDMKSHK